MAHFKTNVHERYVSRLGFEILVTGLKSDHKLLEIRHATDCADGSSHCSEMARISVQHLSKRTGQNVF